VRKYDVSYLSFVRHRVDEDSADELVEEEFIRWERSASCLHKPLALRHDRHPNLASDNISQTIIGIHDVKGSLNQQEFSKFGTTPQNHLSFFIRREQLSNDGNICLFSLHDIRIRVPRTRSNFGMHRSR
jgi:hypothetical protein